MFCGPRPYLIDFFPQRFNDTYFYTNILKD